mgnify:CR=1 FL=1
MNQTLGYVTVVATTLTLFITQQYLENLSDLEDQLPFFHPDLYINIYLLNINLLFRYIVGTKISGLQHIYFYSCENFAIVIVILFLFFCC